MLRMCPGGCLEKLELLINWQRRNGISFLTCLGFTEFEKWRGFFSTPGLNEWIWAAKAFILYILGGALALLVFAIPYLTSLKQSQTRVATC